MYQFQKIYGVNDPVQTNTKKDWVNILRENVLIDLIHYWR